MSIVRLNKVTFMGPLAQRREALEDFQELGCMHLLDLNPEQKDEIPVFISKEAREAFRYLRSCPSKLRQNHDEKNFQFDNVQTQTLEIKKRINELENEQEFLRKRIKELEPWGEFLLQPYQELEERRFWFYIVPHYKMDELEDREEPWQVVFKDNRFSYVVVIASEEPSKMPVPRTHSGNVPLSKLQDRLDANEVELEELFWQRVGLTRWIDQFGKRIDAADDKASLALAEQMTQEQGEVFIVQGWAPVDQEEALKTLASQKGLAVHQVKAAIKDRPPTLMKNTEALSAGEDMVNFYSTPAYSQWDPSGILFVSFTAFFSMIIADAGYGLVFGLMLLLYWRPLTRSKISRFKYLFASLVAGTIAYGVMVGSYFGHSPGEESFWHHLHILNMNDHSQMMAVSIILGISHLILANAMQFWQNRDRESARANLGWIAIFTGGVLIWQAMQTIGFAVMGLGGLIILWFSSPDESPVKRLLGGLMALTNVSQAFSDVLSYLRLFALGLASAQLAITFNNLAADVMQSMPGIGIFFAILIYILGHGLNLILAIMSGVVHGLRLNVIEFFNWGLKDEGYPFQPFIKREVKQWKRSSSP